MGKSIIVSILFALTLIMPQPVLSQDAKALEKQHKETISMLKKSNSDIKKVEVVVESDGNWYFRLEGKKDGDKVYGVADQSGKVIIPIKYYDIQYFPAEKPGKVENLILSSYYFGTMRGESISYNYLGSKKPVFYLQPNYSKGKMSLVDLKGNTIISEVYLGERIPGYWMVRNSQEKRGLLSTDGEEILPFKYNMIVVGSTLKDRDEMYDAELNMLSFKAIEDNVVKDGRKMIDDSAPFADAYFSSIVLERSNGTKYKYNWKVRRNRMDEFEIFDEGKNYNVSYRDEGEKYYEQGNFDLVVGYYTSSGIEAPWAKYFSGMACFTKASVNTSMCEAQAGFYDKNNLFMIENDEGYDLNETQKLYEAAEDLLSEYILSADTEELFLKEAKSTLPLIRNGLEALPGIYNKYDLAKSNFLKRQEEAKVERMNAKLREQQQLRAAILGAFFGVVTKALQPSTKRSYATGGSYAGVSSSTQSSAGGDPSRKAYWESKKRTAEGMLERYREQLKKEPDNAAIKHNIRSQESVLQTCNEMISQY